MQQLQRVQLCTFSHTNARTCKPWLGRHAPELQVADAADGVQTRAQLRAVLMHCQPLPRRSALALRPLNHKVCRKRRAFGPVKRLSGSR